MLIREASRVMVLSPKGRVLLVRMGNIEASWHPFFWTLPGGRGEDGETATETARRELYEETGLSLSLDGPVAIRLARFEMDGPETMAHETFFRARIDQECEIIPANPDVGEVNVLTGFEWHDETSLALLSEPVFPPQLKSSLDAILHWRQGEDPLSWC
jgi:8-oxo-dGTP diphosphatase